MKVQERQQVNPQVVTLARLTRHLTQSQLAKKAEMAQGTISKVEAGIIGLTQAEIEKLSAALDYPAHFFFSEFRVEGPGVAELYHNRKKQKAGTTLLQYAYATAAMREMHIDVLLRSWDEPADGIPSFPIDEFNYEPAKIARTIRAIWRIPAGPIRNLTETIEEAGGIILRCDFATQHIDGFSRYRKNRPPLFFLNRSLLPDRWRWTLAHELGHVVMHSTADPYPEMEQDANRFANEFLMPANEIRTQLLNLTFPKLAALKRQWKVAMQALLMRAGELEIISPRQKQYMFMQLTKAGYRMREPEALDPPLEEPRLLAEIIEFHKSKLGYSDKDIRHALALGESDYYAWYAPERTHLQVVG
jgi:Zn-dependent peptidase ImmA (M78 family)/DNA-binding XRE family transcriptional regulator